MAAVNSVGNDLTGSTGTGLFVGATSPTLVTPRIAQINDTNGAASLALTATPSAVNYITAQNSATSSPVGIVATGSDSDISLSLFPKGTGNLNFSTASPTNPISIYNGTFFQHRTDFVFANTAASRSVTYPDADGTLLMTGQAISTVPSIAFSSTSGVIGTTTNDNAAAGSVGEVISSSVVASPITSSTLTNVTSISLTAGDWNVYGNILFSPDAGTTTSISQASISSTSVTLDSAYQTIGGPAAAAVATAYPVPSQRISLSGTTTIYLVATITFAVSTMTATANIFARRER